MNDLDTTVKNLINSAVDRELGGRRSAPALDRSRLSQRTASTHPVTRWSVPVLAAAVAALLAVGTVAAIDHSRDPRSNRIGSLLNPSPSPSSSSQSSQSPPSSQSLSPCVGPAPDPENYAPYYKVSAGAREARQTAGVTVGPLSAADAALYRDFKMTARTEITDFPTAKPVPGKSYQFTVKYVTSPDAEPEAVLSLSFQQVASGSCPRPFLIRPNHTYLIRCQVRLLAGEGYLSVTSTSASTASGQLLNLPVPAGNSPSPTPSPSLSPGPQSPTRSISATRHRRQALLRSDRAR